MLLVKRLSLLVVCTERMHNLFQVDCLMPFLAGCAAFRQLIGARSQIFQLQVIFKKANLSNS